MHSIAIIVYDNDFGNTFKNLLKTITEVLSHHAGNELSEKIMTEIIKSSIRFHYIAFQNKYEYKHPEYTNFEKHFDNIEKYLLRRIVILFDGEADKAYLTKDYDGGAWHLHTATGQINAF